MDEYGIMGEFKLIFPAVVAATPLGVADGQRDEIVSYIKSNQHKFKKRARDGVVFEESPTKLHKIPVMEPMFLRIATSVRGALTGLGIDSRHLNLQVTRSWANYNTQTMVTGLHTHINSHISIVYYPDDSCAQAPINFMNSLNQNEWVPGLTGQAYSQTGVWDDKNCFTANVVSYTPKPDLCLIFPSNIAHSVSPNDDERARISISMDTLFTLKESLRDEPLLPPPSDWREFEL